MLRLFSQAAEAMMTAVCTGVAQADQIVAQQGAPG